MLAKACSAVRSSARKDSLRRETFHCPRLHGLTGSDGIITPIVMRRRHQKGLKNSGHSRCRYRDTRIFNPFQRECQRIPDHRTERGAGPLAGVVRHLKKFRQNPWEVCTPLSIKTQAAPSREKAFNRPARSSPTNGRTRRIAATHRSRHPPGPPGGSAPEPDLADGGCAGGRSSFR